MKTINELLKIAYEAGFDTYASFNEGLQHEILTCTSGAHNGEVIDIYYKHDTGIAVQIDYSSQFNNHIPSFKF